VKEQQKNEFLVVSEKKQRLNITKLFLLRDCQNHDHAKSFPSGRNPLKSRVVTLREQDSLRDQRDTAASATSKELSEMSHY